MSAPGSQPLRFIERDESSRAQDMGTARFVITLAPTWQRVERGITRLDNVSFNEVSLEIGIGATWHCMSISGGRDGRVLCCVGVPGATAGAISVRELTNPALGDLPFEQNPGGILTVRPSRFSVPRALALRAAQWFFEHRELASDLVWESTTRLRRFARATGLRSVAQAKAPMFQPFQPPVTGARNVVCTHLEGGLWRQCQG